MANLSGSVTIECYKKEYFGDGYNLRNSPEHKLISDEVLDRCRIIARAICNELIYSTL